MVLGPSGTSVTGQQFLLVDGFVSTANLDKFRLDVGFYEGNVGFTYRVVDSRGTQSTTDHRLTVNFADRTSTITLDTPTATTEADAPLLSAYFARQITTAIKIIIRFL